MLYVIPTGYEVKLVMQIQNVQHSLHLLTIRHRCQTHLTSGQPSRSQQTHCVWPLVATQHVRIGQ